MADESVHVCPIANRAACECECHESEGALAEGGTAAWEWDRTYPDEPTRVWKCCGGPYDEAPGGHYVQCTGALAEGGEDRG